jgi:poly(A) polymerase Pap1
MNSRKLETYNLSPDEYLEKFRNPYQVISERGTSEQDEKDRAIIEDILCRFYNDTQELKELKAKIIGELREIVNRWMKEVAGATNNTAGGLEEVGYGLKVFGSFWLKTNSYDGDIDVLCVVPEYFSREQHFFKQLANEFRKYEHFKEIVSIRTLCPSQPTPSCPSCDSTSPGSRSTSCFPA